MDLTYIAEKLGRPIETIRQYHKRATRARREGHLATTWRMPAPDAPAYVSSPGHPRWQKKTADEYIAAKRSAKQSAIRLSERDLRQLSSKPVMVRLTKTEKKLAAEALGSDFWNAINNGPPGWSAAMAPDRADEISGALFDAWTRRGQKTYELSIRFTEKRVPAARTKRGGWRPIRR